MVVGVQHRLIIHRRVNGGNGPMLDTNFIIQGADHRHNAIGGAGCIANDSVGCVQGLVIHAKYDSRINILRCRLGKQHAFGTTFQMRLH